MVKSRAIEDKEHTLSPVVFATLYLTQLLMRSAVTRCQITYHAISPTLGLRLQHGVCPARLPLTSDSALASAILATNRQTGLDEVTLLCHAVAVPVDSEPRGGRYAICAYRRGANGGR
jgi:hypothetical protein